MGYRGTDCKTRGEVSRLGYFQLGSGRDNELGTMKPIIGRKVAGRNLVLLPVHLGAGAWNTLDMVGTHANPLNASNASKLVGPLSDVECVQVGPTLYTRVPGSQTWNAPHARLTLADLSQFLSTWLGRAHILQWDGGDRDRVRVPSTLLAEALTALQERDATFPAVEFCRILSRYIAWSGAATYTLELRTYPDGEITVEANPDAGYMFAVIATRETGPERWRVGGHS